MQQRFVRECRLLTPKILNNLTIVFERLLFYCMELGVGNRKIKYVTNDLPRDSHANDKI